MGMRRAPLTLTIDTSTKSPRAPPGVGSRQVPGT